MADSATACAGLQVDLSWISDLPEAQRQALLNGPAMKPPRGQKSEFDNPPNGNRLAIGLIIAAAILSTLLVSLRTYSRIRYSKRLALEDCK